LRLPELEAEGQAASHQVFGRNRLDTDRHRHRVMARAPDPMPKLRSPWGAIAFACCAGTGRYPSPRHCRSTNRTSRLAERVARRNMPRRGLLRPTVPRCRLHIPDRNCSISNKCSCERIASWRTCCQRTLVGCRLPPLSPRLRQSRHVAMRAACDGGASRQA
jgi:hypothetical protein